MRSCRCTHLLELPIGRHQRDEVVVLVSSGVLRDGAPPLHGPGFVLEGSAPGPGGDPTGTFHCNDEVSRGKADMFLEWGVLVESCHHHHHIATVRQ